MIEAAFREIIVAASLPSGITADRITFGEYKPDDSQTAFVSVSKENEQPEFYSNESIYRNATLRLKLYSPTHATGCSIRDGLIAIFDNQQFTTTNTFIAKSRKENDFALEEEDGTWQFNIDVEFTYTET